jgi:gamma-glutamylcyclotransferase (GGCT)/AIG2-like uncharacterized protein YtfP
MPHLFTYGSLMCPEIMERVAGLRAVSRPATLHHFQRSRLYHLDYPGIFALKDARVLGILYLDLPTPALQRLDDFEGDQYTRQVVDVELDDGQRHSSMTYVLQAHCQTLVTGEEWDFAAFLASGKDHFLATYGGFGKIAQ